jgi:hypothetical protein
LNFVELKLAIEAITGLSQDALHIFAAVIIQLCVAAVLRRGVGNPLPWAVVLLAELVNEWADIHIDGVFERPETWTSLHDVWNTMLLPTLLLIAGRWAPWLLRR